MASRPSVASSTVSSPFLVSFMDESYHLQRLSTGSWLTIGICWLATVNIVVASMLPFLSERLRMPLRRQGALAFGVFRLLLSRLWWYHPRIFSKEACTATTYISRACAIFCCFQDDFHSHDEQDWWYGTAHGDSNFQVDPVCGVAFSGDSHPETDEIVI